VPDTPGEAGALDQGSGRVAAARPYGPHAAASVAAPFSRSSARPARRRAVMVRQRLELRSRDTPRPAQNSTSRSKKARHHAIGASLQRRPAHPEPGLQSVLHPLLLSKAAAVRRRGQQGPLCGTMQPCMADALIACDALALARASAACRAQRAAPAAACGLRPAARLAPSASATLAPALSAGAVNGARTRRTRSGVKNHAAVTAPRAAGWPAQRAGGGGGPSSVDPCACKSAPGDLPAPFR
jgi:hypothetical protein